MPSSKKIFELLYTETILYSYLDIIRCFGTFLAEFLESVSSILRFSPAAMSLLQCADIDPALFKSNS